MFLTTVSSTEICYHLSNSTQATLEDTSAILLMALPCTSFNHCLHELINIIALSEWILSVNIRVAKRLGMTPPRASFISFLLQKVIRTFVCDIIITILLIIRRFISQPAYVCSIWLTCGFVVSSLLEAWWDLPLRDHLSSDSKLEPQVFDERLNGRCKRLEDRNKFRLWLINETGVGGIDMK